MLCVYQLVNLLRADAALLHQCARGKLSHVPRRRVHLLALLENGSARLEEGADAGLRSLRMMSHILRNILTSNPQDCKGEFKA